MAATYCTEAQVVSQLGLLDKNNNRPTLSSSTRPTLAEVTDLIEDAEDEIDRFTNTSWKATTVTDELHAFPIKDFRFYYHGIWFNGYYIQLNNQFVLNIDGNEGDKIEIWTGQAYTDLVATGIEGTGPREGDFYLLEKNGILWLNSNLPTFGEATIKITYRYGQTSAVPKTIRRATILLASAYLIESGFDYGNINVGNDLTMSNQRKAESWLKRAEGLMLKEYVYAPIPQR